MEGLSGSYLEEVKWMVADYRGTVVKIKGASLRIAQVVAVAAGGASESFKVGEEAIPSVADECVEAATLGPFE